MAKKNNFKLEHGKQGNKKNHPSHTSIITEEYTPYEHKSPFILNQ